MPARRTPGQGSVYQLADGSYRGAYTYRDAAGRQRRITARGQTRREATDRLAARRQQLTAGGTVAHSGMTVGEWFIQWHRDTIAPAYPPRTVESYRYATQGYAKALASVRLAALTPAHLERCYAALREQGYAARTIRHTHAVVHRALQDAVRLWLIPRNPADHAAPAVRARDEDDPDAAPVRRVYTPEQVTRLLRTADESGDHFAPLWWLLATTGMRIGEACGLGWESVHLAPRSSERGGVSLRASERENTVEVRRQLQRTGTSLTLRPPKRGGRRTLPLPEQTVQALTRWRAVQEWQRGRVKGWGEGAIAPGFVFTTYEGKHVEVSLAEREFKWACKRAGVAVRSPHILRHTFASILIARGVPITVVAATLGHANPRVTLTVYSHLIEGDLQQAADRIGEVLGVSEGVPRLPAVGDTAGQEV